MIPRTNFELNRSPYEIDHEIYTRFDAARTAFVEVGRKDTGDIGPMNWSNKMLLTLMKNVEQSQEVNLRGEYALYRGSHTINFVVGTYGDQNANRQFLKWSPLFVPEDLSKSPAQLDSENLTSLVKDAAKIYGSDLVGIAKLDRRWVYHSNIHKPFIFRDVEQPTETDDGFVIPSSVTRVVVMAVQMRRDLVMQSPNMISSVAMGIGYSTMAFLALSLAEFIRTLGYHAIPSMNDTALNIPLAIDAGLGQLGRLGLLITPEYGPCVRLCKVLTNMPLKTDWPIDFGAPEFCENCLLCAQACPVNAISFGERAFNSVRKTNNHGVKKWYIDGEKCLRFWQENGASCSNCIAACPFTSDNLANQCLECGHCTAPKCALQNILNLRETRAETEACGWKFRLA